MAATGLGEGLVEVSAVATLIGAPIAQALIHGLKGAAGMVWAPTSTFGSIHVTKACLAASIPDWLRESFGLRSEYVDDAMGVALPLKEFKPARSRCDLGDAVALMIEAPMLASATSERKRTVSLPKATSAPEQTTINVSSVLSPMPPRLGLLRRRRRRLKGMCMYVLDKDSKLILDTIQRAETGSEIRVHFYVPNNDGIVAAWKDWVVIAFSLVKLVESFCLWALGSQTLWYITLLGWVHSFPTAVILQLSNLGRDNFNQTPRDLISGVLPTPLQQGDAGKIVLEIPFNVHRHTLWQLLLGLGAAWNATAVVATFLQLGKQSSRVVYVWIVFQLLWMLARTVVYYFTEGAAIKQGIMVSKSWKELDTSEKRRVLALMTAMALHQVSIHPRGVPANRHETLFYEDIISHFSRANWTLTFGLPRDRFLVEGKLKLANLSIQAVAGDIFLRIVIWLAGTSLDNMIVYDTVLMFVYLRDTMELLAVPSVRVYSCDCSGRKDTWRAGTSHSPLCKQIQWFYWIPLDFSLHSPAGLSIQQSPVGTPAREDQPTWVYAHGFPDQRELQHSTMTDNQLGKRLAAGDGM